jgi:hypothetical protein
LDSPTNEDARRVPAGRRSVPVLGMAYDRVADLRRAEFRAYNGNQVCLELEVSENMVPLSNEDMWHIVLNGGYYGNCSNEREMEIEDAWFDNLPIEEQSSVKLKSWGKIFNVFPPYDDPWESRGKYIQATFWELRLDQVVDLRHFKGRLH